MKKFKSKGFIYTIDDKDEDQLKKDFPDAVEVIDEKEVTKDKEKTDNGKKPDPSEKKSTAQKVTEPVLDVTESSSEDISLELPDPEEIEVKTKVDDTTLDTTDYKALQNRLNEINVKIKVYKDRTENFEKPVYYTPKILEEFTALTNERSQLLKKYPQLTEEEYRESGKILNDQNEFVLFDIINDMRTAAKEGYARTEIIQPTYDLITKGLTGDTAEDDAKILNLINIYKETADKVKISDEMRNFQEISDNAGGGVLGFALGLFAEPSVALPIYIGSLASLAGTAAQSEAGREKALQGAAGGAVLGSAIPGIGTATTSLVASAATLGGFMESMLTFNDILFSDMQKGDPTLEGTKEILSNPEMYSDLRTRANSRGIAIGVIDALTGSMAMRLGLTLKGRGFSNLQTAGGIAAMDAVGGGTGEFLGQKLAGQPLDIQEIGFEAITPSLASAVGIKSFVNVKDAVQVQEVLKKLRPTGDNMVDVFSQSTPTSELQVEIAGMPGANEAIRLNLRRERTANNINNKGIAETLTNFKETVRSRQQAQKLIGNKDVNNYPNLVGNLKNLNQVNKAKAGLPNEIKNIFDDRINQITAEVYKDFDKIAKETFASDIGVSIALGANVQVVNSEEEYVDAVLKLAGPEAAAQTNLYIIKGTGGKGAFIPAGPKGGTILLRKDLVNLFKNPARHELGHFVLNSLLNDNPTTAKKLADNLKKYLNKIQPNLIKEDTEFSRRIKLYKSQPEAQQNEEVLTLFIDALERGYVTYQDGISDKVRDAFNNTLKSLGLQAQFNSGRDVFNFLKTFNETVERGEIDPLVEKVTKGVGVEGGLKATGLLADATPAVEVETETSTQPTESDFAGIIKETLEETSRQEMADKVNKIYAEKGMRGFGEIVDLYEPMIQGAANKLRNLPGYETYKEDFIAESISGPTGLLDLVKKYDPEKGVTLAQYVNSFLKKRMYGIQAKIFPQEFTTDITEEVGVADIIDVPVEETTETVDKKGTILKNKVLKAKPELKEKIQEIVKEEFTKIPEDQRTFKNLMSREPASKLSIIKRVNEEVIVPLLNNIRVSRLDTKNNLNTEEYLAMTKFLEPLAQEILDALPDQSVSLEESASGNILGKSTGLPAKVLQKFYDNTGKRFGKGQGLVQFKKKENLTTEDVLKAIGINEGLTTGAPRQEGIVAQALTNLLRSMMVNQEIRLQELSSPQETADIAAGKSRLMFTLEEAENNLNNEEKKAAKVNNKRLPKDKQPPKGLEEDNQLSINNAALVDAEINQEIQDFYKSSKLNQEFNKILELGSKTKIPRTEVIDAETAKKLGESRKRTKKIQQFINKFGILPYEDDFLGLLYTTLADGKVGEQQMKWYQQNLLIPYASAMNNIYASRVQMMRDFKALKKSLKDVPKMKKLGNKAGSLPYTNEDAVRVYIWNKSGYDIPGLNERSKRDILTYVFKNPQLKVYADKLIKITKQDGYPEPQNEGWSDYGIDIDLTRSVNNVKRARYLKQWQANVDEIFSKNNLNKLEAIYGKNYRVALVDILKRMKTGRNRPFTGTEGKFETGTNLFLTGATGSIMFLNMRSAILQTISLTNFINYSDNNPIAAGKAFANVPQYSSDVIKLMNSDFIQDRFGGLKLDVREEEIQNLIKRGGLGALYGKVFKLGYLPTRLMDSFAIVTGGATFYRNRINTYKKQGLSQKEAEKQAMIDWQETAESSQQSSRPDKISEMQAGRFAQYVYTFQNVPIQYMRLMNKAAMDLKAGRGNPVEHLGKIVYYGAIQNLIFTTLQQGLAFMGINPLSDELKKEDEEKLYYAMNGILNSLLSGFGTYGFIISTLKDSSLSLIKELNKEKGKKKDFGKPLMELADISPPFGARVKDLVYAARGFGDISRARDYKNKEGSFDSSKYFKLANEDLKKGITDRYEPPARLLTGVTNLPFDRLTQKYENLGNALNDQNTAIQRIATGLGWPGFQVGIETEYQKKAKAKQTKSNVVKPYRKSTQPKRRAFKRR